MGVALAAVAQDRDLAALDHRQVGVVSYLVKLETLRSLYDGVQVSIIDPEDEYLRLCDAVGGTAIQLGAAGIRINPLDIPAGDRRPDALTRRALFLHTLIGVLLGQQPPPQERAALDKAITATYAQAGISNDPASWSRPAPLLRDLAATLQHAEYRGRIPWPPGCRRGSRAPSGNCSTARRRSTRAGPWSCGRPGSWPTSCVPPACSSRWTRSGATSTSPVSPRTVAPAARRRRAGSLWLTKPGRCCAKGRARGSCTASPRRPASGGRAWRWSLRTPPTSSAPI